MKQTLLLSHWALLFSSKTSNACLEMKSVSNSLDINVKRISCEEGNPKGQREPHKKTYDNIKMISTKIILKFERTGGPITLKSLIAVLRQSLIVIHLYL
jgi:hypothetical protein